MNSILFLIHVGGVTERNIIKILAVSGATEIHASARVSRASGMIFRNTRTFMGSELRADEYMTKVTSSDRVRSLVYSSDSSKHGAQ